MAAVGFIELLRLAKRADKAYHSTPTEQDRWTGVAFELMGQQFIAPLGEVNEVIHATNYTAIPHTQAWVKGLTNVRGRLLAVSDLKYFLTAKAATAQTRQKILCINHADHYIGVLVDHVYGIQHLNQRHYFAENARLNARLKQFCQGCFYQNNQVWNVFLFSRLLNDQQFMHVAKVKTA